MVAVRMSLPKICRVCLNTRLITVSKRGCQNRIVPVLWRQQIDLNRKLSIFSARRENHVSITHFSTDSNINGELSELVFDQVASETLENLSDQLEELGDKLNVNADFDVQYIDGVLTLRLGGDLGTYVINKQTPNKQIWFSSPLSGPKRYDYSGGDWVYKHDGVLLLKILSEELSLKLNEHINFMTKGSNS